MSQPRRGYLIVEGVAAAALVAVLLVVALKAAATTSLARRALERRAVAQQQAANIAERLTHVAWADITADRLRELKLSDELQASLPGGAAQLNVEDAGEGPPGKCVAIEITWPGPSGEPEAPLRLTTWVYAPHIAGGSP